MKRFPVRTFQLAFWLTLTLVASQAHATLYCNRPYAELEEDPGQPLNAVGYLSNGCTASLIGRNHIVAAAHCLVDSETGAWQTDLRFYPNFHPDRVSADEKHVPRGDVIRAVVGSRAGGIVLGTGSDWGIARIDNWTDTGGLDLTALTLAPSVPAAGTALSNPAYTRHHFPYDDHDAVLWDNMEWDDKVPSCAWVNESSPGANDGGMWAIQRHPAPVFDGVHRDRVACNSRWAAGMIHANCSLSRVENDVLVHNCDTIGGSSGSPILYRHRRCLLHAFGSCLLREWWRTSWYLIGVGSGGGTPTTASSNDFSQQAPACSPDVLANRDNAGPSVERFRDAPRFATNVAVHRQPGNPRATTVFAVDGDLNRVVYRTRLGAPSAYTGNFSFWKNLSTPHDGAKLTRIAACSADAAANPELFVVSDDGKVYARSGLSNGGWGAWFEFGVPSFASGVVDLDATTDPSGRCQLLVVTDAGDVATRTKATTTTWGGWAKVAQGSYRRVTSLRHDGELSVAMVDAAGEIWRTSSGPTAWTPATKLGRPPGISAWLDVDMTWDEHARGFMLAVPAGGGNKLYFMPMYGDQAWSQWRFFETRLWAPHPKAGTQPAPSLGSITASRWMEDPAGTTSPVVFGTDDSGNVYFVEYTRVGAPRWVLDWKSFYHESILYH